MSSVLIVAHRALPSRGGLAIATSRIAAHAAARGESVNLLVVGHDAPPGGVTVSQRDGVRVFTLGRLDSEDKTLLALVEHGCDIARTTAASLVHGIYATVAGYAATIIARRVGVPSIVSLRGNDLDEGLYQTRKFPMVEFAIRNATAVTGVSRALCDVAANVFDREAFFIGNSVDSDVFRPETPDNSLRASLGLGGSTLLGYSGELREKKGIRFLLPAFAQVAQRRDVRLLVIGGIRAEMETAVSVFRQLAPEADARVHIVEYGDKPKRLCQALSLCSLMVFPSLREGMPNAVLESMACGLPVLATAVGGHLDLIDHGRTGALIGLEQLDALPWAIEELLDREDLATMGRAARDHVVTHHAPLGESHAWAEVYEHARRSHSSAAHVRALYPRPNVS